MAYTTQLLVGNATAHRLPLPPRERGRLVVQAAQYILLQVCNTSHRGQLPDIHPWTFVPQ